MPKKYQQGCVDVIALDERLSSDDVEALSASVQDSLHRGLPQLIFDLRRVRVIDSAGLEFLCDVHELCVQRGGALRLAAANNLVRDVLYVTGVEQDIGLFSDVVTAAGAFAL